MQALIFAFISFIGWGTGDIFATKATRKLGSFSTAFWINLFGIVPAAFLFPFFLKDFSHATIGIVVLNISLGILLNFCWIAYNEALRKGNPSLVGTIAGAFPAIVVMLSLLFLGEKLSGLQGIAIIVILMGFLLSSLNFSGLKRIHVHLIDKSILLAIFALLGWGIYFTFIKYPVKEIGWFWANYISIFVGTLYFPLVGLRKIVLPSRKNIHSFIVAVFSAILLGAGLFSFNLAISKGSSAIVTPIAGSYPVLFVFLSSLIFKDPITKQQKCGIFVTLIGIVALSFFGR